MIRVTGLPQAKIGEFLGKSDTAFSRWLGKPDVKDLPRMDEITTTLVPDLIRTGGLSAHTVRLRRLGDRSSLTMQIPPSWMAELLSRPVDDEFAVLTQASILLQKFTVAPTHSVQVTGRYEEKLRRIIHSLIMIGASPSTPRNAEALIRLGGLAGYAFDAVKDSLEDALRHNPFGFRVWRALTTVVVIHQNTSNPGPFANWVARQVKVAEKGRALSLFSARSLDLELALVVPPGWTAEEDWVGEFLKTRAKNVEATVRERGTAAFGLWERTLRYGWSSRDEVKEDLRELVATFRDEDKTLGLRWVAATLKDALDGGYPVTNTWPKAEEESTWRAAVDAAADYLESPAAGLPERIRWSTRRLFEHTVMQNAGVHRRHAIDTLLAGGWTEPVIEAYAKLLADERSEAWLRCRALFATSFLQDRSDRVMNVLEDACRRAMQIVETSPPSRSVMSEMHAALFAVGDCFGVRSARDKAGHLREQLDSMLVDLLDRSVKAKVEAGTQPCLYDRIARAAGYLIVVTAEADPSRSLDLVRGLAEHPDPGTKRLAEWALRYRFDGSKVRPLYAAIPHVDD